MTSWIQSSVPRERMVKLPLKVRFPLVLMVLVMLKLWGGRAEQVQSERWSPRGPEEEMGSFRFRFATRRRRHESLDAWRREVRTQVRRNPVENQYYTRKQLVQELHERLVEFLGICSAEDPRHHSPPHVSAECMRPLEVIAWAARRAEWIVDLVDQSPPSVSHRNARYEASALKQWHMQELQMRATPCPRNSAPEAMKTTVDHPERAETSVSTPESSKTDAPELPWPPSIDIIHDNLPSTNPSQAAETASSQTSRGMLVVLLFVAAIPAAIIIGTLFLYKQKTSSV